MSNGNKTTEGFEYIQAILKRPDGKLWVETSRAAGEAFSDDPAGFTVVMQVSDGLDSIAIEAQRHVRAMLDTEKCLNRAIDLGMSKATVIEQTEWALRMYMLKHVAAIAA